ncbi:MAG: hypothetical protein P8129_08195 [Anaerolineae bacterium]|jgi:hypothetical protein
MPKLSEMIHLETHWGEPVSAGDVEIVPQSRALTVRWPWGGYVWNRPVGVLVRRGGEEERVPIVDVTRVAQAALLAFSAMFPLIVLILSLQKKGASK